MTLSHASPLLTDEQRGQLLELARAAVVAQVTGAPAPDPLEQPLPDASGVFVTVKARGVLRGCLGTLQSRDSLARDVAGCAADAASRDPRFPQVTAVELPEITIEVSVLGPLEPIDPPRLDAIVIGRHGLVVEQGRRRGLLLPQVATEHGWTAVQFLHHTCIKAALPGDAWQHGAKVSRFEADVFGETDADRPPSEF